METEIITPPEETTEYSFHRKSQSILPKYSNGSESTNQQQQIDSSTTTTEIIKKSERIEGSLKEKILEWWMGTVLNVYSEEGYFEANLEDSNGITSIVKFDIDTEQEQDIVPKARFVFSVFKRHGQGSPETANRIEFIPPIIWTKEEKKELKEIYTELFPDSPSLLD